MSLGNNLSISFYQVGISWKAAQEDAGTHNVTLKGTFEASNGKKFEVTVTYNKEALADKVEPGQLNSISGKIQNALNQIETNTLAKLSGHTLRTNYEELQKKTIHVIGGGNKELANWQNSPLSGAVTKIQNVFRRVFEIEGFEEKKIGDIKLEFEEVVQTPLVHLKSKIPPLLYQQIQPKLKKIGELVDEYDPSRRKKDKFYKALADRIEPETTEKETSYQVKLINKNVKFIELNSFLSEVEELLSKGSFILGRYVDGYLNNVVSSSENTDTAYVDITKYRVNSEGNQVQLGKLDLDPTKVVKVLIPVNINNKHWILYCFDATDREKPVLRRCDSKTDFTNRHIANLQNLEKEITADLHQAFNLDKEVQIIITEEDVTQQKNNNCGAHVCKNAEWFASQGKFNPDSIEASAFSSVRLDMLLAFLK